VTGKTLNVDVYFDPTRLRIDPILCVNDLTFFHLNGWCDKLEETFGWVESVLEYRALDGMRVLQDRRSVPLVSAVTIIRCFLVLTLLDSFLSPLLEVSLLARMRLGKPYAEQCWEWLNVKRNALALAMRVVFCAQAGIDASGDLQKLFEMQDIDVS
jgi:hypothetical protein